MQTGSGDFILLINDLSNFYNLKKLRKNRSNMIIIWKVIYHFFLWSACVLLFGGFTIVPPCCSPSNEYCTCSPEPVGETGRSGCIHSVILVVHIGLMVFLFMSHSQSSISEQSFWLHRYFFPWQGSFPFRPGLDLLLIYANLGYLSKPIV